MKSKRRIEHPDWVVEACKRVASTGQLLESGRIPPVIQERMIVVPIKHALRGVYGSDLKASWELLTEAIGGLFTGFWEYAVIPFWHFKVLRKSRQQRLAELDIEAEEL